MKQLFILLLGMCYWGAEAQVFCLRAGKSVVPGDYVSLRYTHPSRTLFHLSVNGFFEKSHQHNLHYTAFGLDVLGELHSSFSDAAEKKWGLGSAIGLSWQAEYEPWLYKDWSFSKRTSLGLVSEINGRWYLSDAFILHSFLQQKILFNTLLGRYRFVAGLGVCYRLPTY